MHDISTGSYDCTAKVFRRDSWELLHNITLHTDSVWDLKIHGDVMATAGLDGTVGVFDIVEQTDDVIVRFILQASVNQRLRGFFSCKIASVDCAGRKFTTLCGI